MADKKSTAKNDGGEAKEGTLQYVARKLDKLVDRLETLTGLDLDGDGKLGKGTPKDAGYGYVKALIAVAILCAGAGVFAANVIDWAQPGESGSAKIDRNAAGITSSRSQASSWPSWRYLRPTP